MPPQQSVRRHDRGDLLQGCRAHPVRVRRQATAIVVGETQPTSAKLAQVVAPTESGVVVATFWDSAEARDGYQSQAEHREALQASGLLDAVKEMRSRVFEDAELKLT